MGEHGTRAATRRAAARFSQELASSRLALTAALVIGGFEAKANFNPDQPREPRGRPTGGRWVSYAGERLRETEQWFRQATSIVDAEVAAFLVLHREDLIRILGAVQAASGAAEVYGGGVAIVGGLLTIAEGGALVAALGVWMVANGIDNVDTGWRILTTGRAHTTHLYQILRDWGLSDSEASWTEVAIAGGPGAVSGLTRRAVRRRALAAVEARALDPFTAPALQVRSGGRSIWSEASIQPAGEAWEYFDAGRTGYRVTRSGFPGVDQISPDGSVVISNKTLNVMGSSYQASDTAVLRRLRTYINQLAAYPSARTRTLGGVDPIERRLHLLLPSGRSAPGQALQLEAAQAYARARGIILQVEYAN